MNTQFKFEKYCSPAQLYLILAVIGLVSGFLKNFRILTLIFNAIFVILFAWILNLLCLKGFTTISWVLVFLPFILLVSTFFLTLDAGDKKNMEIYEGLMNKPTELPSDDILLDKEKREQWCIENPLNELCQAAEKLK